MSLIDAHVCNGGGRIKGCIRKYHSCVCSLCRGDGSESIEVQMSEKNIDIYNRKLLDKQENNYVGNHDPSASTNN